MLPIVEPVEDSALSFALTLTAVIMLIGTVVTGLIEAATVAASKILIRTVAQDYPPIGILRIAADLAAAGQKQWQQGPQFAVTQARYAWQVADYVERLAVPALRRGDLLSSALSQRASLAAHHLRVLALQILIASSDQRVEIVLALRRIALCLLLGLYGRLVEPDESDSALLEAAKYHRGARSWATWTVVTALPAAAVTTMYLLHLAVPETVLQWITAFAAIWLVVRTIAVLEPNYRAPVQTAIDLVNAARELPGKR